MVSRLKELKSRDMSKKGIYLRCVGKLDFDHNYRFKSLVVIMVDEDRSDDDVIIIVCDKKGKRRQVNLVEKSGTTFIKIGFSAKKNNRFQ